jgi:hypothetical protein
MPWGFFKVPRLHEDWFTYCPVCVSFLALRDVIRLIRNSMTWGPFQIRDLFSTIMRSFYSVVLAGIMWYLIFPPDAGYPVIPPPSSKVAGKVYMTEPLSRWTIAARYGTAEQCEEGREQLTAEATKILKGGSISTSDPFSALMRARPGEKTAFRSLFL